MAQKNDVELRLHLQHPEICSLLRVSVRPLIFVFLTHTYAPHTESNVTFFYNHFLRVYSHSRDVKFSHILARTRIKVR